MESHREQKTDDKSNTYNIKELTEVLDVFSVLYYFFVSRVVLGFFQRRCALVVLCGSTHHMH